MYKKHKYQGRVLAIIGAQYGSEGKGVVVNKVANDFNVHVRVGGPNAGHSFVYKDKVYKMQVIPCGWTNPKATVIVGRGALVNPDILKREIEQVKLVFPDIEERILIDSDAGVLDRRFAEAEGHTKGELHERIGSTGEGVGAARIARIERDRKKFRLMRDIPAFHHMLGDTVKYVNDAIDDGENVLLEGAQGSALSMIHGPYPFVTSHDTNVAQMAADIGISPLLITDIMLVARTYPIRVAGNSGPLKNEITWAEMSKRLGRTVSERTTVTKKIRRIGEWDDELMDQAVMLNRPTSIAVTFVDYLDPKNEGAMDPNDLTEETRNFLFNLEHRYQVPVKYIGTGGLNATGDFQVIEVEPWKER